MIVVQNGLQRLAGEQQEKVQRAQHSAKQAAAKLKLQPMVTKHLMISPGLSKSYMPQEYKLEACHTLSC